MKILPWLVLIAVCVIGCGASPSGQKIPQKQVEKEAMQRDYYKEGIKELKDHNIKAAIMDLNKEITQNPKNGDAYLMLGKIYMNGKAYESAIKYLKVASTLEPDNGKIFLILAECYNFNGDTQEAINNVKKGVLIFKKENDAENYKKSLILLRTLTNSSEKSVATTEN